MPIHDPNDADREKLELAKAEIAKGNVAAAKQLLSVVIQNTPSLYAHQTATPDGRLIIRFWDLAEFLHYAKWVKPTPRMIWQVAVYPPAYYYLGYIGVAQRDYRTAIAYLDSAAALEPTNPKITLEKAQALGRMKRHRDALALFEQVSTVGPFISELDIARALRGKGYILCELGQLDDAEQALRTSLEFDPKSIVAQRELQVISTRRNILAASRR